MEEIGLEHPWAFAVVVVVVWILLWVGIEVIFFDDDMAGAVITGAVAGLAFALLYSVIRRQINK